MKKRLFLVSCAVTMMAGTVVLSSCSSKGEEYSYSPENAHNNVVEQYKANFVKYYGQVNPNETWDFSERGSQLAGFAGTRANNGKFKQSVNVQDMKDNQSYGYNWKHSNDHSSEINDLCRLYWDKYIKDAIDAAPESDWNPSGKIIFDVLITTQDQNSSAGHFTWGIAGTQQGDLFMRQVSPANGRNWKNGNTGQQHTSSLDFSMIPDGVTWFTSHTAQNQKKYQIDYNTNSNKITKFKNVTVTIPETGKTYTFWCFKCDESRYADYKDLVLWVSDFETIRTPVASKRYMVEDLGGIEDFDFNDVVFDVVKYSDNTTWCYVRALGGTLDVTIKVANSSWTKSDTYNPYTQMLNTNNINKDDCLGEFQVVGDWDDENNSNIFVEVKKEEDVTNGGNTVFYYTEPFPAVGAVPLIIATPISKTWRRERDTITEIEWFTISDIDLGM